MSAIEIIQRRLCATAEIDENFLDVFRFQIRSVSRHLKLAIIVSA
jgi:hypothetical protein